MIVWVGKTGITIKYTDSYFILPSLKNGLIANILLSIGAIKTSEFFYQNPDHCQGEGDRKWVCGQDRESTSEGTYGVMGL